MNLINFDRNSLATALLSTMRKWAKSSSSKETNVPRSIISWSRMAWIKPPSRCMVSELHIPYVQVICSKRKIGGIYNIIFVVFFTFVDMIFAHGLCRRLSNMFLFCMLFMNQINHVCILHSEAHISGRRA
jgi:hypothetical protein